MKKVYLLIYILIFYNVISSVGQDINVVYRLKSFYTDKCKDGLDPENEWRIKYSVNNNTWSSVKHKNLSCAVWWAGGLNDLWIYNNSYTIGGQETVSGFNPPGNSTFENYLELWEEDWRDDNKYDEDVCLIRVCPCFGGCCFCALKGSDDAHNTWDGDPKLVTITSALPNAWKAGAFERDGYNFGFEFIWSWDGEPTTNTSGSLGVISPLATTTGGLARFCPGSSVTITATHDFNPGFDISYVWYRKKCNSNCSNDWQQEVTNTSNTLTINYESVNTATQYEYGVQLKSHGVKIGKIKRVVGIWFFPPPPNLSIIPHPVPCKDEKTGMLEYVVSGGVAPYYFDMKSSVGIVANVPVSSSEAPGRYFFLSQYAGTFTGIVESSADGTNNGGGCYSEIDNIVITQPDARPSFTYSQSAFNGFNVHCNGNQDGYIDLNLTGGTAPYRTKIDGGNWQVPSNATTHRYDSLGFINDPSTLSGKNYIIEITDINNCTVPSQIVAFTQPAPLTATGFSKNNFETYDIHCFEYSDGAIQVNAGGGVLTLPYTFSATGLINQSDNPSTNFINLGKDRYSERPSPETYVYNFTVTDANMCITTTSVTLTSPPKLEIVYPPYPEIHGPGCFGQNNGYIVLKATGGVTTTTVAGNVIYHNYNYNIKNTYSLTTETNTLQTDFEKENILLSEVLTFNGMSAGGYVYTVSGDNACTFTGSFVINQPNPIVVHTVTGEVTCKGGNDGALNPWITGGTPIPGVQYLYEWKNEFSNVLTVTAASISGLRVGDYSLKATDLNGCSNGNGTFLRVNEPDKALQVDQLNTIVKPVDCFGGSTGSIDVLAKGGWPSSYNYSMPALNMANITGNFRSVPSGTYEMLIKDSKGCTVSGMLNVPQPGPMLLSAIKTDIDCYGHNTGSITAMASGGYGMLKFSDNALSYTAYKTDTLQVFTELAPGYYPISVKDQNNCLTTIPGITITQPGILLVDAVTKDGICGSATGIAMYTISGGTLPYSFDSDISGIAISNYSYRIENLASGPYKVEIQDARHCSVTGVAFIRDRNGPLVIGKLKKGTDCSYSADGMAEVRGIAASGKFISSYSWISNRQTLISTTTLVSGLKGNQTIMATATDNDGCNGADYIYVSSPQEVRLALNAVDPTCNNFKDGRITTLVTGGTPPYAYLWDDTLQQVTSEATGLRGGREENSFQPYNVNITDSKNCTSTGQAFVQNPEALKINFSQDSAVVCIGQNVGLDLQNQGLTYQWTKDGVLYSNEQVVFLDQDGLYEATVTNANNCSVRRQFKLKTSNDVLDARFLLKSEVYAEDTILLAEVSRPIPTQVQWILPDEFRIVRTESDNRNGISDRTYVIISKEGTYEVGMKATLSTCTDSLKKEVIVLPAKDNPKNMRIGYTGIRSYQVIPNPANVEFTLHIQLTDPQPVDITIRNAITTQVIDKRSLNEIGADFKTIFDIGNYPAGMYFIEITTSASRKIIKLMKE